MDLLKIQTGVIFVSTIDNEVLMPNLKLVDLILLNPKKYKNLKIFSSDKLEKYSGAYNLDRELYSTKNQKGYYDDNLKSFNTFDKKENEEMNNNKSSLLNDEYVSKDPLYSVNYSSKYNYKVNDNYDEMIKNRNSYLDDIGVVGKKENEQNNISISVSTNSNNVPGNSNSNNNTLSHNASNPNNPSNNNFISITDTYNGNKTNQTDLSSKYNYSERIRDDLNRQRFSSEKRNYRNSGQYLNKSDDKNEEKSDKFNFNTNNAGSNYNIPPVDKFSLDKYSDKLTDKFANRYGNLNAETIFNERDKDKDTYKFKHEFKEGAKEREIYKFNEFKDFKDMNGDGKSKLMNVSTVRPQLNFNSNSTAINTTKLTTNRENVFLI
jgi:hypothetical protein